MRTQCLGLEIFIPARGAERIPVLVADFTRGLEEAPTPGRVAECMLDLVEECTPAQEVVCILVQEAASTAVPAAACTGAQVVACIGVQAEGYTRGPAGGCIQVRGTIVPAALRGSSWFASFGNGAWTD